MGEEKDSKKELLRAAQRPLATMLMIISSGAFLGTGMAGAGNTLIDTWCWATLGILVELFGERILLKKLGKA